MENNETKQLTKEEQFSQLFALYQEKINKKYELFSNLKTDKEQQASKNNFLNILKNDAKWTGLESLGLLELISRFETATDKIELTLADVQALYYFLSKIEGVGIASAKRIASAMQSFKNILDEFNNDTNDLKKIASELEKLEKEITEEQKKKFIEGDAQSQSESSETQETQKIIEMKN
jgi:ribosomal protein S13